MTSKPLPAELNVIAQEFQSARDDAITALAKSEHEFADELAELEKQGEGVRAKAEQYVREQEAAADAAADEPAEEDDDYFAASPLRSDSNGGHR